jgi:hypothetical protein
MSIEIIDENNNNVASANCIDVIWNSTKIQKCIHLEASIQI